MYHAVNNNNNSNIFCGCCAQGKSDDMARRMEALKANDIEAYRELMASSMGDEKFAGECSDPRV
jgi:hypothetical protein